MKNPNIISAVGAIGFALIGALAVSAELKTINITDFECRDTLTFSAMPTAIDRCIIEAELDIDALDEEFPIAYVCWFDLKVGVNTSRFDSGRSEQIETMELRSWTQFTAAQPKVKIKSTEKFRELGSRKDQIVWARLTSAMCVERSVYLEQNEVNEK